MHLATLALLQVVKFPNTGFLNTTVPGGFDTEHWQCTSLPNSFSFVALQKKCSSLLSNLNVCCAVWNDCYEQKKGEEYCNKQYYGCNQIVLSTASPQDFKQCSRFPDEVKDHLEYTSPKPASFALPDPIFYMNELPFVDDVYDLCPAKARTITACLYNYFRDEKSLKGSEKILSAFNLRICMEMILEPKDGERCHEIVQIILNNEEKNIPYNNTIRDIRDRSEWKCGANRFDTYVTQVVVGMKCMWLKEAFNTCCKHQTECYNEYDDKFKCDKAWDSCNSAVITNFDESIVQECLPFMEWVDNYQKLSNVYAYKHKPAVKDDQTYVLLIVFGCVLSILLVVYFIGSLCCKRKTQKYHPCEETPTKSELLSPS